MEKQLIKGKWYWLKQGSQYENIIKYDKGTSNNPFGSEYINIKGRHNNPPTYNISRGSWLGITEIKEVNISEIAKYLPKDHPDLKLLQSENCLQNLQIW